MQTSNNDNNLLQICSNVLNILEKNTNQQSLLYFLIQQSKQLNDAITIQDNLQQQQQQARAVFQNKAIEKNYIIKEIMFFINEIKEDIRVLIQHNQETLEKQDLQALKPIYELVESYNALLKIQLQNISSNDAMYTIINKHITFSKIIDELTWCYIQEAHKNEMYFKILINLMLEYNEFESTLLTDDLKILRNINTNQFQQNEACQELSKMM
jgi:hypothetical protein